MQYSLLALGPSPSFGLSAFEVFALPFLVAFFDFATGFALRFPAEADVDGIGGGAVSREDIAISTALLDGLRMRELILESLQDKMNMQI